jgi:hypothetical protein
MSRRHKEAVAGSHDLAADALAQCQFAADHEIKTIGIVQMGGQREIPFEPGVDQTEAVAAAGFEQNPGRIPIGHSRLI